jgi:hypothetical protein
MSDDESTHDITDPSFLYCTSCGYLNRTQPVPEEFYALSESGKWERVSKNVSRAYTPGESPEPVQPPFRHGSAEVQYGYSL